jgi:hypothetical protein
MLLPRFQVCIRRSPICNKDLHQHYSAAIIDIRKSIVAGAGLCYKSAIG